MMSCSARRCSDRSLIAQVAATVIDYCIMNASLKRKSGTTLQTNLFLQKRRCAETLSYSAMAVQGLSTTLHRILLAGEIASAIKMHYIYSP